VAVVLDEGLMDHDTAINAHPLVNTMTTSVARDDLVRFLEHTGHPPRIVAVAADPAPGPDPEADCICPLPGPFIGGTERVAAAPRTRSQGEERDVDVAERRAMAAAAPDGLIKDTTTQSFMKDVIEESKRQPVLSTSGRPGAAPASSSPRSWKRWSRPPRARSSSSR
jgi:hypothetical protein